MEYFASADGYRYYTQWVGSHYIMVLLNDIHGYIQISEFGKYIGVIHSTANLDELAENICTYLEDYRNNSSDLTDQEWYQIAHAGIASTSAIKGVLQSKLF
jgi:hypothetical protein